MTYTVRRKDINYFIDGFLLLYQFPIISYMSPVAQELDQNNLR